jgi:Fic family protein
MSDIQRYINRIDPVNFLTKTALLHYQMEVVHPFESGNGKIGCLLILLYLFKKGILTHTALPVSEVLLANKVEYFDRIAAVYNYGHYEQWVKFFLRMISLSATTSNQRIEKMIQLRKRYLDLISVT